MAALSETLIERYQLVPTEIVTDYHLRAPPTEQERQDQQHDDQRKDHERFDKHQTENHRQRNAFERAWVAGQAFASRCADTALAESAKTGSDAETDNRTDVAKTFGQTASATSRFRRLSKRADRRKQNNHQTDNHTNYITSHCFFSSKVKIKLVLIGNCSAIRVYEQQYEILNAKSCC